MFHEATTVGGVLRRLEHIVTTASMPLRMPFHSERLWGRDAAAEAMSARAFAAVLVALLVLLPTAAADPEHLDVGESASFALFPTHDEVVAGLAKHEGHPWVTYHDMGTTVEGRPIRLAEVTDPASPVPMEGRVVTFIFTQQHGNEPAGTPAALALLDDIAAGKPIADTLANQILLLLPMANPDGATANQRANAKSTDINRDHAALASPEARILHDVLNRWDVHVAMDHHEYSGQGFGNPVPIRVYDYDLTTLFPVHGLVRAPTADAAKDLMYEGIWPAAEAAGYSANEYGEQTAAGIPINQLAGGPDPAIQRNHLGLHHVAGLLVETRVDAHPNPFHDAARREAIHRVVMDATLEHASTFAQMFRDAKRASEAATLASPASFYQEAERAGKMPDAFRVDKDLSDVFLGHGLPAGIAVDSTFVHNLLHAHQAHTAALLHPNSSRALAAAVATDAIAEPIAPASEETPGDEPLMVPGAGAAMAAIVAAAAVVLRRRRG